MPVPLAHTLAALPATTSMLLGKVAPERHLAGAFAARAVGERHQREFAEMVANADRIVAISAWSFEALKLNGVPAEKLAFTRSGVDTAFPEHAATVALEKQQPVDRSFRLLYLGRWDPLKGVHVLVRAVMSLPRDLPIELVVHGIANNGSQRNYAASVCRLADGDARIRFEPPLQRSQLLTAFSNADALAVPSLWFETAPLVILEAQAAGLQIIGSRLGGIPELVQEPKDGLLVSAGDVAAWANAIRQVATAASPKPSLNIRSSIRTMRHVAEEIASIYKSLS